MLKGESHPSATQSIKVLSFGMCFAKDKSAKSSTCPTTFNFPHRFNFIRRSPTIRTTGPRVRTTGRGGIQYIQYIKIYPIYPIYPIHVCLYSWLLRREKREGERYHMWVCCCCCFSFHDSWLHSHMSVVCGSSMLLVASYGGGPAAMAAGWQRQGQ